MSDPVMNDPGNTNVTSDDRLFAALAYVFTPLVPVIILLMQDKKDRPFIKAHNGQALAWGVVLFILNFVLSFVTFGLFACVWPLTIIPQLYWGYKAYQGEMVNIPVVSGFVKNQGWA